MFPPHRATFAICAELSRGGVFRGAKRFVRASRIRKVALRGDAAMGHLDPLLDYPADNTFVKTVVPFLSSIVRSPH